ncbi:transmembrane protein 229A-like [Glandiceps talaboti]
MVNRGMAPAPISGEPIPWYIRFFIYGIHGIFDEVFFTAIYDYIFLKPDLRLMGYTSLYSFFMYGFSSFIMERLYVILWYKHGVGVPLRVTLYVFLAYSCEFTCGTILRQFDACSWDYSDRALNVMGLITFTYIPVWSTLALFQDVLAEYILNLRVMPSILPDKNKVY